MNTSLFSALCLSLRSGSIHFPYSHFSCSMILGHMYLFSAQYGPQNGGKDQSFREKHKYPRKADSSSFVEQSTFKKWLQNKFLPSC